MMVFDCSGIWDSDNVLEVESRKEANHKHKSYSCLNASPNPIERFLNLAPILRVKEREYGGTVSFRFDLLEV